MSIPFEHDYIGFSSEVTSKKTSDNSKKTVSTNVGLNMKATELRLGLPGSESPERDGNDGPTQLSIGLNSNKSNGFVSSGAKRGFSVAIQGGSGGNWVFSGNGGSDHHPDFTPRGANNCGKVINGSDTGPGRKDGLPLSPKAVVAEKKGQVAGGSGAPASKAQIVGWPPIRSFRKNTMASHTAKNDDDAVAKLGSGCLYVKVCLDGAPYLRKADLRNYGSYSELSSALEKMFSCFTIGQCSSHGIPGRDGLTESRLMDLLHGSEYVLTYEDKDGDWMLVGDVPWKMFTESCKRLRIMKSSDAIGLAPRAMEKCKNRN